MKNKTKKKKMEKSYKLKPEFEGVTVSKNILGVGNVIFDPKKVDPQNYVNYVKMGFEEMFVEILTDVIENVIEDVVEKIEEKIQQRRGRKKKL